MPEGAVPSWSGGKVRRRHADLRARADRRIHVRFRRVNNRLLHKEHAPRSGEAAHQMLRPLKYEIPPQVRQTEQPGRFVESLDGSYDSLSRICCRSISSASGLKISRAPDGPG